MKIELVEFTQEYLDCSWHWLNDEEINRLTDTGMISKESQQLWCDSLSGRYDYKVWGVESEGNPIGVCGLKHISQDSAEYFGYIGDKSKWGGTVRL